MENLQNVSKELKNLNFSKNEVREHIKDIKQQAEHLVLNQFPCRVLELQALLKTSNFCTSETASAHNKLILERNTQSDDTDGIAFKKRKFDVDSVARNNHTGQIIPCNNLVLDEVELIKPRIGQLLEDIQLLKMWIQSLTPGSEDANDFIKSVFDDIFNEIQTLEDSAKVYSDQIPRHFLTRGKVIAKAMKYPQVEDYWRAVQEIDANFRRFIKQALCDIKNDYATLHDMISKNLQRIKNHRKFDPRAMY